MSIPQYLLFLPTNPFLAVHSTLWTAQAINVKAGQVAYETWNILKSQTMTIPEYASMIKFFKNHVSSPLNLIRVRAQLCMYILNRPCRGKSGNEE